MATAQDIINISNSGGGQQLYDMVRNGQLSEADVRAALGSGTVDAFLARTNQAAPTPTVMGVNDPAGIAPGGLFDFGPPAYSPPVSTAPTDGNIAISGQAPSGNINIPASQGAGNVVGAPTTTYTPPPAATNTTTQATTPQTTSAPPPTTTSTQTSAPTSTGQLGQGANFNTQVPGGTTQNNNFSQYPTPIPTSPNYEQAANQQGQANLDAAKSTVALSNPNQITPYGSQTYTIGPDGRPVQNQSLSPDQQRRLDDLNSILPSVTNNIREQTAKPISSYDFSDVMDPNSVALSDRKTGTGVQGQSAVAEALRAREQPRLDKKRQQLEAQLLTRGFNPGTEGWNEAIDDFSRSENDFNLGLTALSGQEQSRLFDLDSRLRDQELGEFNSRFNNQTSNRTREINEQVLARTLPVQEYQGLVNAMTPQLPQFNQYQGTQVDANPIFDATTAKGIFDLGRYGTSVQGELGTRGVDTQKGGDLFGNVLRLFGL